MTINIGINLGEYILLAADTRSVLCWGTRVIDHSDEAEKIQETKAGLITGAGYEDILEDVKDQISKSDIIYTDEIIAIITKSREKWLSRLPFYSGEMRTWIKTTSWLLTYITLENESPVLRLSIIHPEYEDKIAYCQLNKSLVVMPGGSTPKQVVGITRLINKNIKPLESLPDLNQNINYHVVVIRSTIQAISQEFDSVGPSFQIGIQTIDGKTGVSDIIKDREFSISLK